MITLICSLPTNPNPRISISCVLNDFHLLNSSNYSLLPNQPWAWFEPPDFTWWLPILPSLLFVDSPWSELDSIVNIGSGSIAYVLVGTPPSTHSSLFPDPHFITVSFHFIFFFLVVTLLVVVMVSDCTIDHGLSELFLDTRNLMQNRPYQKKSETLLQLRKMEWFKSLSVVGVLTGSWSRQDATISLKDLENLYLWSLVIGTVSWSFILTKSWREGGSCDNGGRFRLIIEWTFHLFIYMYIYWLINVFVNEKGN